VRSAHKSHLGEIKMKKTTLMIALAIFFTIGVFADGEQHVGGKTCVPTPTQPCTNLVQLQPTEEPIVIKIINFLKSII
jgi:hypothetical protein